MFPRLEALYSHPSQPGNASLSRVTTGIETLDEMLGGGLAKGSVSLLMGPSGIGKTSLGLAFLGASTPEAPGLHFGF
ncbi:ATPase domain-containing protein, partial [Acinetobacter baumannii]|uniref:ATPase domain-containing protein n=1 Tax=Acinetobacter baumannii TaxID=470 RepID=UPI00331AAA63